MSVTPRSLEKAVHVLPVELLVRGLAAHRAARAVRRRVQRLRVALAAHDKSRRRHRAGNDAQHARARRRRAFAMHDDLALHAVNDVLLLPREVVVVLQIEQHLRAEVLRDVPVNARVVRRRVLAHQLHRVPVFLAFLRIERQPREPLQFARQIRELVERDLAVMIAHRRARAATAAVRQQRHVSSRLKLVDLRSAP